MPNEVSFVFLLFANQIRSPPHRLRNRIRLKQGTILPTDEEIRVTGLDPPKTWRAIMAGALSLEFRETLIRHSRQERSTHAGKAIYLNSTAGYNLYKHLWIARIDTS